MPFHRDRSASSAPSRHSWAGPSAWPGTRARSCREPSTSSSLRSRCPTGPPDGPSAASTSTRTDSRGAIAAQHVEALRAVGIDAGGVATLNEPAPPARGVFNATPSAQAVFRRAVELSGTPKPRRLLGAHVVLAVTEMEHGTAARALRQMGVDREQLADAARDEMDRIGA